MGLLELAERCEAATEADRELDELIAAAMNDAVREVQSSGRAAYYHKSGSPWMHVHVPDPGYTASVDAAMTLIPDDEEWSLHRVLYDNNGCPAASVNLELPGVLAATPALALTAASLRARHALALSKGSDT